MAPSVFDRSRTGSNAARREYRSRTEDIPLQPPPQNLEAERSVLGAIILEGKIPNIALTAAMATGLTASDFFLDHHRRIFRKMCALEEAHIPSDLIVLRENLQSDGELEAAGGAAYLAQLVDGVPRISNVEHYARIVKEKAVLRGVISSADAVMQRAFDGDIAGTNQAITQLSSVVAEVRTPNADLKTFTAPELIAFTQNPLDHLAYPVATRGLLTVVDGMVKLSGKTTLCLAAASAALKGQTFLGHATQRVRVLLVSEENPRTLNLALQRSGLTVETDFYILPWPSIAGVPWPTLAAHLEKKCLELGIGWLWLDTFYAVAGFNSEQENDAGLVESAIAPLRTIAGTLDTAVTLNRHERKSGGDIGASGRGSIALAGACDVIVRLQRLGTRYLPNFRELEVIGRTDPDKLVIEFLNGEYVVHAGDARISTRQDQALISEAIASNPKATVRALAKMTGVGRNRVQKLAGAQGWLLGKNGWHRTES